MTDSQSFKSLTILSVLFCAVFSATTHADDNAPTPEQLEFFESKVRPLLVKHCYECHSVNAKRIEGKLLLDSRAAHLRGGDSGEAIVPGDADSSLLIEAVRYESFEMPPQRQAAKQGCRDSRSLGQYGSSMARRTYSDCYCEARGIRP
ncbi:hypothetical protein OAF74_02905 [bacterium]|nr:hypothetical protein [bacterium]